jgi:hypothetical protein
MVRALMGFRAKVCKRVRKRLGLRSKETENLVLTGASWQVATVDLDLPLQE